MTAESLVMVIAPSVISWVLVEIQFIVDTFASGWGATIYLPSQAGVLVAAVSVMDSSGLSHVLADGACSEMRLQATPGVFACVLFCEAVVALDLATSLLVPQ